MMVDVLHYRSSLTCNAFCDCLRASICLMKIWVKQCFAFFEFIEAKLSIFGTKVVQETIYSGESSLLHGYMCACRQCCWKTRYA